MFNESPSSSWHIHIIPGGFTFPDLGNSHCGAFLNAYQVDPGSQISAHPVQMIHFRGMPKISKWNLL